jgi:diguanylate cyclase (GGDEF)-like protein/PAS domain S-box-containing protein
VDIRPSMASGDLADDYASDRPGPGRLEILNDELKQALEKYQALNEELLAANEELEAAKDGLLLVNAQLNSKNEVLTGLNIDFKNLLESTQIAIVCLDRNLRVRTFSPNMAELFALRSTDVGRPITDLSTRLDYATMRIDVEQVLQSQSMVEREVRNLDGSGPFFLMRMRPYRQTDGGIDGVVMTFIDITTRKHDEDQAWFLAHHDQLTGLPNRAMFHATLERSMAVQHDVEHPASLMYLDLDRFKNVNDAFGHRVGDRLLQLVAMRLRNCVRTGDMVCRIGGDEFAIMQHRIRHPDDTTSLADRILDEIGAPYEIDGHMVQIGVSIGIVFPPAAEKDVEAVLRAADVALYDAKARGRDNHQVFRPDMQHRYQERRGLEADLREAVARDQLTLLFQPVVRLDDRRIVGAEALLRWQHHDRGMLLPQSFVPLAEEAGLMEAICDWVLRRACRAAAAWPEPAGLSVNLSASQLADPDLVVRVRAATDAAGLAAARLTLEVSQAILAQDDRRTGGGLAALRALGVTLAIDDFGTGYGSLGHLGDGTAGRIKIDPGFTQTIDTSRESFVVIDAIASIGRGLDIAICADGVESASQLAVLEQLGVGEAQGRFLFPPMAPTDFAALLAAQLGSAGAA